MSKARQVLWTAYDRKYRVEMRSMERSLVLHHLDSSWKKHLLTMDHLRSGIVMIGDGVRPAGTGHGYVLRRLLRRVLTMLREGHDGHGHGVPVPGTGRTLADLPAELVEHIRDRFRQAGPAGHVKQVLLDEEQRFTAALDRGRR